MNVSEYALPHLGAHTTILDVDLDQAGSVAVVWESGGRRAIVREGAAHEFEVGREVGSIRWLRRGGLAVWPYGGQVALLQGVDITPLVSCSPRELLDGGQALFAAYGEGQFLAGTADGDPAGDRVTVFDRAGTRLFGAADRFGHRRTDPRFMEYTAGTVTLDDQLVFVGDGSDRLWTLDPRAETLVTTVLDHPVELPDDIDAVLSRPGHAGLMTILGSGVRIEWFDVTSGALVQDEHAPLPDVAPNSGGRYRSRGVAGGAAIVWDDRRLFRIAAAA